MKVLMFNPGSISKDEAIMLHVVMLFLCNAATLQWSAMPDAIAGSKETEAIATNNHTWSLVTELLVSA
jgi:hypothetical protein